jgi:hypothetical protein
VQTKCLISSCWALLLCGACLHEVDFHTPGADLTAQGEKLEKLLDVLLRCGWGIQSSASKLDQCSAKLSCAVALRRSACFICNADQQNTDVNGNCGLATSITP